MGRVHDAEGGVDRGPAGTRGALVREDGQTSNLFAQDQTREEIRQTPA